MKIMIAGGTGFVGRHLSKYLVDQGHSIIVLSRQPKARDYGAKDQYREVLWNGDGSEQDSWLNHAQDVDAMINLSGAPIADQRWTTRRKQEILHSRVQSTKALIRAISGLSTKPKTFITASGIGFYGDTGSKAIDESAPLGTGFLSDLSQQWEHAAQEGEALGMRVVQIRFGMILGNDGGALPKMMLPFQWFVGGPIMPGSQYVSWIHIDDVARLIDWLLTESQVSGPINGVSPTPVTMKEFCATLGRTMNRPSLFPVPGFVLKIALGEMADMLTTGQHVLPQRALENGFTFTYTELPQALEALLPQR